jgi:NADH-quinone oxidoreductase subunit L
MATLLPFIPVPGLLGFILLALAPMAFSRTVIVGVGVGAGVLSALLAAVVAAGCAGGACASGSVATIMRLDVGGIAADIVMTLDPLSVLAGATVAAIGALVLIYAAGYMAGEPAQALRRFFAQMNLFLAGMLTVVLAADALLLFLGWETIGLCSFFLIAYDTRWPKAVAAGRKALLMTRIADTFLLAGLILLCLDAGATGFGAMLAAAPGVPPWRLAAIAGLIAAGALGKSAQIPFQTWLPSAMTGPTPVSALLHSATMVAAGVMLLARLAPLFAAAPAVAAAIAAVGLATAALGAVAALAQRDVKKLLAYSTISQIGYMVLALGVGARDAALALFTVHAVFKSLLFLSAGAMSRAAGGSTAIADLRGSMRRTPLAFWTFAAGAASLAGLPAVTAGWFSKEALLAAVWASGPWGVALWAPAALAAVLTGAYAFRVIFIAARPGGGEAAAPWRSPAMRVPLLVLAALALGGGRAVDALIRFLGGEPREIPALLQILGGAAPLLGAALTLGLIAEPRRLDRLRTALRLRGADPLDIFYDRVLVRPFRRMTRILAGADAGEPTPGGDPIGRAVVHAVGPVGRALASSGEPIGRAVTALGDPIGRALVGAAARLVNVTVAALTPDAIDLSWMRSARRLAGVSASARGIQNGRLRDYAMSLAIGAAALLLFAWGTSWR